jgi:hypothetical protein
METEENVQLLTATFEYKSFSMSPLDVFVEG